MSAKKNVNQSRPRALADARAAPDAGAACCNGAGDANMPAARRSSGPPARSSESVDRSLSPAPRGLRGVGFWPGAPCTGRPSFSVLAHLQSYRTVAPASRKFANAANLRKPLKFHGRDAEFPIAELCFGTKSQRMTVATPLSG